ncbi:MAG: 2Fe-2S iron-sulfur cluster-binding protein [Gammaproteobacteria bacterium]|nr:2Fe-2S iron-sulfur cluster-binding protein [Gammaproteobacteria bacterium]
MRKYHSLTVTEKRNETQDSIHLALDVPAEIRDEFRFLPGQHLPMQIMVDGKPVRRTYSICSVPGEMPLRLGIRVQPGGIFSEYVQEHVNVGDQVDVMPPFGQFHADIDPSAEKTCLAFAAGSGITPILSIVRATLEMEANSRVVLFYGNRRQRTTMFIDELYALKNRFPERLQLYFLFSQEDQEFDIFSGRLDETRVPLLYRSFCTGIEPDKAYICGPDSMIENVQAALIDAGMKRSQISAERFGAPRREKGGRPPVEAASAEKLATVDVIMDGHKKSFDMLADAGNIVDAAADQGIELPYSCKGGVCATCRTFVREGEVRMATNYGLEPWEVDKGFVLACQSVPISEKLVIDYDKT